MFGTVLNTLQQVLEILHYCEYLVMFWKAALKVLESSKKPIHIIRKCIFTKQKSTQRFSKTNWNPTFALSKKFLMQNP